MSIFAQAASLYKNIYIFNIFSTYFYDEDKAYRGRKNLVNKKDAKERQNI